MDSIGVDFALIQTLLSKIALAVFEAEGRSVQKLLETVSVESYADPQLCFQKTMMTTMMQVVKIKEDLKNGDDIF